MSSLHGCIAAWLRGHRAQQHSDAATQRHCHGNMATWQQGTQATQRRRDIATSQHGHQATQLGNEAKVASLIYYLQHARPKRALSWFPTVWRGSKTNGAGDDTRRPTYFEWLPNWSPRRGPGLSQTRNPSQARGPRPGRKSN